MAHRLSSRIAENNAGRCVTMLVTSLAEFTRHISFLVSAEIATLFNVGSDVCSSERFNERLQVPWFLTRLNEKTEKDCTAFLRAFLKQCVDAFKDASNNSVHVMKTDNTTVRFEISDEVFRTMINNTSLSTKPRPAKRFAGRGRTGGGGKVRVRGGGGGGARKQWRAGVKRTEDSTSLVCRIPPSHKREVETNINKILTMMTDLNGAYDDTAIKTLFELVDAALQPHGVEADKLPDDVTGKDVVVDYSTDIKDGRKEYVREYSRTKREDLSWCSRYVCAESHFFPTTTLTAFVKRAGGKSFRASDPQVDFLGFAMTDAALLLLCETTGYQLVSSFRSNMAFLSLKPGVKIFCTPAGVAFDPVSSQLFLLDVHIDSMLVLDGALDSERESFRMKRTDLIYSLEIFGLTRGILVDIGFDRASLVRTMRLEYVTYDSELDTFGEKKQNLDTGVPEERMFVPSWYVQKWGALGFTR